MITSIKEFKENRFSKFLKIGKVSKSVNIELDLEHSKHSMERKGRSSKYIKDSDIKETVNLATEELVSAMMSDKIDTNDPVLITNDKTTLNIVGTIIYNKKRDVITFKVITVMFNDSFIEKKGTYKITV